MLQNTKDAESHTGCYKKSKNASLVIISTRKLKCCYTFRISTFEHTSGIFQMYRTKSWIPNPQTTDTTLVPFPDTCAASTPTRRASAGTGAWHRAYPAPQLLPGAQSPLPLPAAQTPSRPQLRDPRPVPSPISSQPAAAPG